MEEINEKTITILKCRSSSFTGYNILQAMRKDNGVDENDDDITG